MPRALATAALMGTLVACTPAPTTEAPGRPTLVIEPSETELPTTAKRSHRRERLCIVSHDDFASTRQRWRLLVHGSEDGPRADDVWGMLEPAQGGRATAELLGEHDEDTVVLFDGGGLELETSAMSEDIQFYPGAPIWFQGVALPAPVQTVVVQRADDGRVTLALDVGEELVPSPVVDRAPCDALAFEPADYDVAELTHLEAPKTFEIVGDTPVPLFPKAEGGRSGLALALDAGTRLVAGPREGTRRRVRVPRRGRFTILGWVPDHRLRLPPGNYGWGGTGGWGRAARHPRGRMRLANRRDYRCLARVALWVVLGDRQERVGAIAPQREFFVGMPLRPVGKLQPVFFDDSPVTSRNGARLAVPTRELSGCTIQP